MGDKFFLFKERKQNYLFDSKQALKISLILLSIGIFLGQPGNLIVISIPHMEDGFRLGFPPLITMLGGILLGPLWGMALGGVLDFVSVFFWHGIENYVLIFGLLEMLWGFLAGLIFHHMFSRFNWKAIITSIIVPYIVTTAIGFPLALNWVYGAPIWESIYTRLTFQALVTPIYFLISYFIVKGIKEARKVRELNEQLEKLLKVDELTGLSTRRHFYEFLGKMVALSHRQGRPLSVIIADFDEFKKVNDTFGHLVGDRVLAEAGSIFKSEIRQEDMAGRIGGEEFSIILPGIDISGANKVAERVRKKIKNMKFSPLQKPISLTLGVAELKPGYSGHELMESADKALYRGKQKGKDIVVRVG